MSYIRPLFLALALSGLAACQSVPAGTAAPASPLHPPIDARQGIALLLARGYARDGVGRPELKVVFQDKSVRPQSITAQVRYPVSRDMSSPQTPRLTQVYRCFTISTEINPA